MVSIKQQLCTFYVPGTVLCHAYKGIFLALIIPKKQGPAHSTDFSATKLYRAYSTAVGVCDTLNEEHLSEKIKRPTCEAPGGGM